MTEMSNGIESVIYTSLKGVREKNVERYSEWNRVSNLHKFKKGKEKKVSTNHFQVLGKAQAYH